MFLEIQISSLGDSYVFTLTQSFFLCLMMVVCSCKWWTSKPSKIHIFKCADREMTKTNLSAWKTTIGWGCWVLMTQIPGHLWAFSHFAILLCPTVCLSCYFLGGSNIRFKGMKKNLRALSGYSLDTSSEIASLLAIFM